MVGRRGDGQRLRSALALAAIACALPGRARPLEALPLALPFPSPEPDDPPHAWLGARAQLDWEPFAMTLSDGTRYARATPGNGFAAEGGITLGPRLATSAEVTGTGVGAAVQVDLWETPRAKTAAIVQAEFRNVGPSGGAALAASAVAWLGGARLVPFVRVGAHAARASLDRGVRNPTTPYNEVERWELAAVGTAGVTVPWRSWELGLAGGYRAIAAAGRFDELRPADPTRRGGAVAAFTLRWVFGLGRRGG